MPTRELIDELFVEEVRKARSMPLADKLLAGARLFEAACMMTAAGIRRDHPEADQRRVQELLKQRIELAKRLEESP
jgi:hypothetical protein